MRLPDGTFYLPRQEVLIAKDADAQIRIVTVSPYATSGNGDYAINPRTFEQAIAPYLRGDWEDFHRLYQLSTRRIVGSGKQQREVPILYCGAEHRGRPKLPNITVVPNLS